MPNDKRGGDKDMFKIKTNSFCDFLSNCEFNFNLYFEHIHPLDNIIMILLIESYYKIILTPFGPTQWRFWGGGGRAMALGLALFMPTNGLALLPPPPPPPPPPSQRICQNVLMYSVRCLKVVPGVPKMVLIRSKSKKYPPISSKAACKICLKVIPDGPKMA